MITLRRIFGVLTLLALVACGGGGGGGGGDGFDGYKIPIAAGTGAAMAGASVTVDGLGDSKSFNCSGTTDENGYITCNVPANFTPPFVITVYPADTNAVNMKSVVVSPTKGKNPRVPVTPLTNLLIQADSDFYQKAKVEDAKVRLEARKKQITDALTNVISQILSADKAKNFDFLSDSSFVPGSNDGSDLLLDNISVDIQSFKLSLKNGTGSGKSVTFNPNTDPTNTAVRPITVSQTDVVRPTTRLLKEFAGVYDIDVTFTSFKADGSVSVGTQTKSGPLALNSDGTFDSTVNSTRWSGKYTLNDKGTSVKISGTVGGTGPLVGSIDNNFKMTLAFNTKGSGADLGQTTKGSVVSKTFTPNPTQSSGSSSSGSGSGSGSSIKALSDFAGSYAITLSWRMLDNSDNGTANGTVTIDNSGAVTSCTNFQIFINCRGTLALNTNKDGANLTINGWGQVEGVGGSAVINGSVSSAYKVSGNASGKDQNGTTVVSATFTGSKN